MVKEILSYFTDYRFVTILALIILGLAFLSWIPLFFGIVLGALAWLGLTVASKTMNKWFVKIALSVSKILEAKKYTIVELPDKYDLRFVEKRGFVNVLWNVFLLNLLGTFAVVKYFGTPKGGILEFMTTYLLAIFIASILAAVITPIAVNLSAIEMSKYRVLDTENMLMTYPAYLFYRAIKSIFGLGNLAVIVAILTASITAAGDIGLGLSAFMLLMLLTFSSVALGSLMAVVVARFIQSKIVENLLDEYNRALAPFSKEYKSVIEILKQLAPEIKESVEVEEAEESEKDVVDDIGSVGGSEISSNS